MDGMKPRSYCPGEHLQAVLAQPPWAAPQEPTQAMLGIEPSSSQQTERGFCAVSSPPASHPGSDFGICRMEHPEQHPRQEGMGGGHRLMQCSPDIHQEGKSGF